MFSLFFLMLSVVLTKAFFLLAQNTRLMDEPNERSMHSTPTVRGGGIVFIVLPLLSLPYLCYAFGTSLSEHLLLIISCTLLAGISFLDDLYTLSIKPRFIIQAAIALCVAILIGADDLNFILFTLSRPIIIIPFLFLAIIWAINHFNFMDGLDGFCALQAVFLFAAYALLFDMNGALIYKELCLIFVCSLLGFLLFNFPPAKLFMGDVGSATLGLITFFLALIGQQKYGIPIVYWFLLNGLFLFDATVTLLRRVLNKERWYAPHKKHAYQRLKQLGVNTQWILVGQALINALILLVIFLFNEGKIPFSVMVFMQLSVLILIYLIIEKKRSFMV